MKPNCAIHLTIRMIAAATVGADKKVKKSKPCEKAREMRPEKAVAIRLIFKGMRVGAESGLRPPGGRRLRINVPARLMKYNFQS